MDAQVPVRGIYDVDVIIGIPKRDIFQKPLGADLFECTYGALPSRRMIKRNPHAPADPPEKFDVLCSLEHPTVLAVSDFLLDKSGNGCLVVESADEAFEGWMERTDPAELFIETSPGKVRLSPLLRAMILELASLGEALGEEKCYLSELPMEKLFIKNKIEGRPTLKVLLDYNVVSIPKVGLTSRAIRGLIDYCCKFHNVVLDASSSKFKNYIGDHRSLSHLERYPDSWSDEQKKDYIFMILCGDKTAMSLALSKSKVDWPWDPTSDWDPINRRRKKALPVLEGIRSHNRNLKKPVFYAYDEWGFIQLCRNVLKKFNIPQVWKADIADRVAFLRKMEHWNSKIWTDLYEKIGPLEGGEVKC